MNNPEMLLRNISADNLFKIYYEMGSELISQINNSDSIFSSIVSRID